MSTIGELQRRDRRPAVCLATRSATLADAPLGPVRERQPEDRAGRRVLGAARPEPRGRGVRRRGVSTRGGRRRRGQATSPCPTTIGSFASTTRTRRCWTWARWKRRQFTGTVIAVTGSAGKTTTRQMIHTVLQSRLRGTASPRNFNNHYRRAVEHDGHRAGPRLRRAGTGREPAGRDRRAGRVVGAEGRRDHPRRRRPSRRFRQPAADRPGQGRTAGRACRPTAGPCWATIPGCETWPRDCARRDHLGRRRRGLRSSRHRRPQRARPVDVPRGRLPVLRARLGTPPPDRGAGGGGRRPNDGLRPGRDGPRVAQVSPHADALPGAGNSRRDDHQRRLQLESDGDAGGVGVAAASSTRPAGASSSAATWASWATNRPPCTGSWANRSSTSAGPSC